MKQITRRSLLTAGVVGTAGVGALVAGDTSRGRRWLHSAGLLDGPDLAPPELAVSVEYDEFASRAMKRPVRWGIATPAGPVKALVVCLHGRGASEQFAFESVGVHRFVEGDGLPFAVASPDGGSASYWHRRGDGTDAQAMLFEELVPMLEERLGQLPLILLGWSMGGYGALLAAADRRADVRAVAAASPAMWESYSQSAPGAFDDAADFKAHDLSTRVEILREMRIRIDCGADDPFVGAARAFAARLPEAESDFGAGFHDTASWRHRVPHQLDFFRRALANA